MTLEAVVFQQDPFCNIFVKDLCTMAPITNNSEGLVEFCFGEAADYSNEALRNGYRDQPPMRESDNNDSSSPDVNAGSGSFAVEFRSPAVASPSLPGGRRKRRRTRSFKNKEELESQRMTHIAVERNRRRQMNDYLAVLRSLMPPSYAQRGDQASIVGGAINFVKELEQLLQFLQTQKQLGQYDSHGDSLFADFFTFPQYTTRPSSRHENDLVTGAEKPSTVADIEVTMVESHANIKILSNRYQKQLLKIVSGFQSVSLSILHLNITTFDQLVLYSFSVKVEDDCQLTTVNEIAASVHEMLARIQEETMFS